MIRSVFWAIYFDYKDLLYKRLRQTFETSMIGHGRLNTMYHIDQWVECSVCEIVQASHNLAM